MKVLIIEDEMHAVRMLTETLLDLRPDIEIVGDLDSVKSSLNWLQKSGSDVDLIFMDIELADGRSFEIFKHIHVSAPVIFTTAYDQFALEAFKVNAIDYLLKPIASKDLEKALARIESQDRTNIAELQDRLEELSSSFKPAKKNRCLVKKGEVYEFIHVEDIALAYSEDSVTFLITFDAKRHIYSRTIEQLYVELDEKKFYQVNRGELVNVENVIQVHPYLGQRLKLKLKQQGKRDEILVSRQRSTAFKQWLDS